MKLKPDATVDEIIDYCNDDNPRKSAGRILTLPMNQMHQLMHEYDRKPDGRFGDNLLDACKTVDKWQGDPNYRGMFRD